MSRTPHRLIVTAASREYGPSVVALVGSVHLNWPDHPPVRVYDLGLDAATRAFLVRRGVRVDQVPPFCPHWRQHYTWKLWCLADAPARDVLWLDAGLTVLQPLDEIFDSLERQGYFFSTNHQLLDWEASEEACRGCGVAPDFRLGKLTLPATLLGLRKEGVTGRIVEEALAVAMVEKNIAATEVTHRHDQAIISLLAYKHLGRVSLADGAIYLGQRSPTQVPGQRVWAHRRAILREDLLHFAQHLGRAGAPPHQPRPPVTAARAAALEALYRVYWHYGRRDRGEAAVSLETALRADPSVRAHPGPFAAVLSRFRERLGRFSRAGGDDFVAWALGALDRLDPAFAGSVSQALGAPFAAVQRQP